MRLEKHGRGVEQAWQMLDTFASLGVHAFDLTRTDIDGHKRGFRAAVSVELLRRGMPGWLESALQLQHNLIVRPKRAAAELVQLDDLDKARLEGLRCVSFLILSTSAGNHQAWVAVRECAADFARGGKRQTMVRTPAQPDPDCAGSGNGYPGALASAAGFGRAAS